MIIASRPPVESGSRSARARLGAAGVIVALGALLAACAGGGSSSATGGSASSGSTPGGTPSATATVTTATATPTQTPLSAPFHLAPASASQLCKGAFGPNAPAVYAFGKNIYAEPAFALSYPSYTLPAGTPLKPFKLGQSLSSLDQVFGGPANANPSIANAGGIIFTVCNNGSSTITLNGVGMGIIGMTPHTSAIDTWQMCDGVYQPGVGVTGGGCGGAVLADENMRATFAASAGVGAKVNAAMVSASGPNGYGPLPVSVKPGATITLTIAVAMPTTSGTYTLGVTLSASGVTGAPAYAPLAPQLFATVTHKWNGQNCKTSGMLSQIPSSDTSSYFICPA